MSSESISSVQRELFDADVHAEYQASGKLRECVRKKVNKGAKTWHFPNIGKIVSVEKHGFASIEQPQNVDYEDIVLSPRKFTSGTYTDIFESEKVEFDDRQEIANIIAKAMGRREDQLIIDGLSDGATEKTVAKNVDGSNTGLTVKKLRETVKQFGKDEIEESVTFVGHTNQRDVLLGETEVTSSDYNSVKALTTGEVNSFLGMKFKWIGDRDEGGLKLESSTRECFAFAEQAVVMGLLFTSQVKITWIAERGAFYVVQRYSANSKVRDKKGVVKINTHETA